MISSGNAEKRKGFAAAPRHAYRAQTTVIMGGPASLATDYTNTDGPRFSEPRPRRSPRAVTLDPSDNEIRQNKGLHRTAHKLPHLRGFAMITPVEVAHYSACALSGEP